MNCTETTLGLLFTENEYPKWVGFFAIIFVVLIFLAIKFLYDNYQDYDGAKRVFFFLFIAPFVYLCMSFFFLIYPISQWDDDFTVSLNYKNTDQEIFLSSEINNFIYKDNLKNYKAFYVEFERSSQKSTNNNIMGKYHLYLLRKDGLLLSLHTYGISNWEETILPLLKNIPIPLIKEKNLLDIPTQMKDSGIQLSYDVSQLSKNLKKGIYSESGDESVFQYKKQGYKFINQIIIPLLLLFWTGAILHSVGSHEDLSEGLFKYLFLLIFSGSWCFYYVLAFGTQTIALSKTGYSSYNSNKFIDKMLENKGEWKDVKKIIAYAGNGNNVGITIYETEISTDLRDIANALTSGKTKTIQIDGLNWYDQILLADYVLFKSHSPE